MLYVRYAILTILVIAIIIIMINIIWFPSPRKSSPYALVNTVEYTIKNSAAVSVSIIVSILSSLFLYPLSKHSIESAVATSLVAPIVATTITGAYI